MTAFLAIVKLTCRAAFRSRFFRGIILFFLGAVLLMPLIVKSDGTAVDLEGKLDLKYTVEQIEADAKALGMVKREYADSEYVTIENDDEINICIY